MKYRPACLLGFLPGLPRFPGLLALLALLGLLGLLGLLTACRHEPLEQRVAARVNGRPIAVRTLEFSHALSLSTLPLAPGKVLDALKAEYGQALAGLIVEELVAQELARQGLEIGPADLSTAERAARTGFPGRTFEDTLAEEGIDLTIWRERLKARTDLDVFEARVLRSRVSITPEEAQGYYKAHAQEFVQPVTVTFIKAESRNAESLRQALVAVSQGQGPASVLATFADVSQVTQAAPEEALPKAWREVLKGLKPGQAGAVVQEGAGCQAFILLDRSEAKVEGLVQVYPLVEKRLAEDKMALEFSAWLAKALAASVIEVSPGLVPEKGKW